MTLMAAETSDAVFGFLGELQSFGCKLFENAIAFVECRRHLRELGKTDTAVSILVHLSKKLRVVLD